MLQQAALCTEGKTKADSFMCTHCNALLWAQFQAVRATSCAFTSKCFVASSFLDISMSLVRMLRRCMSLRMFTLFTVASLADYRREGTSVLALWANTHLKDKWGTYFQKLHEHCSSSKQSMRNSAPPLTNCSHSQHVFTLKTLLLNYTLTLSPWCCSNLSTIYILVTVCVNKRAKETIKDNTILQSDVQADKIE